MYKIFYDDCGNISQISSSQTENVFNLNDALVPEHLNTLIEKILQRPGLIHYYKVDMDSKDLEIIDTTEKSKSNIALGYITEIQRCKGEDLQITIKTLQSKPHILISSKHETQRTFNIYMTTKKNVNHLLQSFSCETNQEHIFEIDQIDYRDVFKNNFSLYYNKIFTREGYNIQ